MAYLDKEAYERKNEYAAKRMIKNSLVETLTPKQHEVLASICQMRHKIHTHQEALFFSESSEHTLFWAWIDYEINAMLSEVNLPEMKFNNSDDTYITDSTYELDELTYDEGYKMMIEYAEKVNHTIENYLKKIDEKHETEYCPTGNGRIF